MTDLTDKWKKGELPEGRYYVENNNGIIGMLYWSEIGGWYDIKEVKAKVPTYEEYQALLSDQLAKNEGVEINTELEHDCKTLAQTLLKVSPEHKAWLEKNYKEYL